jgi:hypothetical protein
MKYDRRQKVFSMIDKHNVYGKSKMKERVFNHCYVFCLKTQFLSINQRIVLAFNKLLLLNHEYR